jgi:hypothetical protein
VLFVHVAGGAERKQAWVVTGIRTPLLSAAAGRLLSAAGWVQLQLSVKELDRTGSNPQSQAQRLVQLSQVADLLPRLSAMIRDHKAKQQLKQQQQKTEDQGGGWGGVNMPHWRLQGFAQQCCHGLVGRSTAVLVLNTQQCKASVLKASRFHTYTELTRYQRD